MPLLIYFSMQKFSGVDALFRVHILHLQSRLLCCLGVVTEQKHDSMGLLWMYKFCWQSQVELLLVSVELYETLLVSISETYS